MKMVSEETIQVIAEFDQYGENMFRDSTPPE